MSTSGISLATYWIGGQSVRHETLPPKEVRVAANKEYFYFYFSSYNPLASVSQHHSD